MLPEEFFELFCSELQENKEMDHYYKFGSKDASFGFRKNYFLERLRYIHRHITDPSLNIYDCGCGYGTTCLFLAMNGIRSYGETLEFYYEVIQKRIAYWQQFGDTSLFSYGYENLFDKDLLPAQYDTIIVQDTLHHLEPIHEALSRLYTLLKPQGALVVIEENGNNIIQNLKLYKQRGNKRVVDYYDEKLGKQITMGNENIRPLHRWQALLQQNGLRIDEDTVNYIRYYLPFTYRRQPAEQLLEKERILSKKQGFRREYLFFGINFIARKQPPV